MRRRNDHGKTKIRSDCHPRKTNDFFPCREGGSSRATTSDKEISSQKVSGGSSRSFMPSSDFLCRADRRERQRIELYGLFPAALCAYRKKKKASKGPTNQCRLFISSPAERATKKGGLMGRLFHARNPSYLRRMLSQTFFSHYTTTFYGFILARGPQ